MPRPSGALPAAPHGVGRRGTSRVVARVLGDAGVNGDMLHAVHSGENGDAARDAWWRGLGPRLVGFVLLTVLLTGALGGWALVEHSRRMSGDPKLHHLHA